MSDESKQISFREMLRADVAAGLGLCRASRWNQLSRDWECFLKLSPRGCRVAVKDDRVVGTVTTVIRAASARACSDRIASVG